MTNFKGFWSYVHTDDQADGERITRLARDVKDQFQMLTGEEISLFLDKDSLEWGQNWREAIDSDLASVAFFIPVMTPRYFMSPECRRELQSFARRATNLGIKELILPVLYVDVPEIHDENTTDELIQLVRTFQWEDWQDLRFLAVTSEGYRRGISRLATRLVEANRQVEETTIAIVPQIDEMPEGNTDESPGFIDRLAYSEETLLQWPETLKEITQDVQLVGKIMEEATEDIQRGNAQGKGFAARLVIARRVAHQLSEPVEHIWSLSNKFVSQLHDVDEGFRTIIERAPAEIKENPDAKANFCEFFENLRKLVASSNYAFESAQGMITAMEPLEKMSRDLRPVIRRLKQGLTIMIESKEVINEWLHLLKSSGVLCEGMDTQK